MQLRLLSVAVAAFVAAGAHAAAQSAHPERPERPYRGLFGSGVGNTEQLLTLSASAGGGYDDNVLANAGGGTSGSIDPRQSRSGSFGQMVGALSYSLRREKFQMGSSLSSSYRYYDSLPTNWMGAYTASVGASAQVTAGTTIQASQSVTHQPFLSLAPFPSVEDPALGLSTVPRLDLGVRRQDGFRYGTMAGLTQSVSRRGAVTLSFARNTSDLTGTDRDLALTTGRGLYTQGLTRGLGLRLGYGLTSGRFSTSGGGRRVQTRTLDAGLDFRRALSFSRRTMLTFGTGSSAIVDGNRAFYRLIGDARLIREIGRTWSATLAYDRHVGFLETFADPFFADAGTLALGGSVSRRVQFASSASASTGQVGLTGTSRAFDTYRGALGFTYGLTRNLGLALDYSYYRYAFHADVVLPDRVPRDMNRQSVTASLQLWAPLVNRARRPDASR